MSIIFSPPIAFLIVLVGGLILLRYLKTFAHEGKDSKRKGEAYACGERNLPDHVRPQYNEFFAYAFFFTIMHVLVMLIATVPKTVILWPIMFILATVFVLYIVLKKEDMGDE